MQYAVDPKLGYVPGTFIILCREPGKREYIRGGHMAYHDAVHHARRYAAQEPNSQFSVKREGEG
jgi:hypothetical protein